MEHLGGLPEALLTTDHDAPVQQGEVQDGRNEPFLQATEPLDTIVNLRGGGDDLYGGVVLLEAAAHAHEGAAGAQPGDEVCYFR